MSATEKRHAEKPRCTFHVVGVAGVNRDRLGKLRIAFEQAEGPGVALTFSAEAESQLDRKWFGQGFAQIIHGRETFVEGGYS